METLVKSMKKSILAIALLLMCAQGTMAQDQAEVGKTAPDFVVHTLEGKEVSLSDYRGKVVYIDFWASWCGPCKKEMPHAAKIKKHFAGKDVVFLNVSVDRNQEQWEKSVKALNVGGVNGIAKEPDVNQMAFSYGLNSIPAFVLVDKKGKLVAFRANRPSSNQALINQIDSAL